MDSSRLAKMRYIFRSHGNAARLQLEVGIHDEVIEKRISNSDVDVFHMFKILST